MTAEQQSANADLLEESPVELFPELPKVACSQVKFPQNSEGKEIVLGSGTFGEVVLGYFRPLGCLVAVKRLKSGQDVSRREKGVASIMKEAKVAALLNVTFHGPHLFGILSETEAFEQLLTLPPPFKHIVRRPLYAISRPPWSA